MNVRKTANQVRNLGVTLDPELNFKTIARIRGFMSRHDLEILIHASITSRFNHYNGLFSRPRKSRKVFSALTGRILSVNAQCEFTDDRTLDLNGISCIPYIIHCSIRCQMLMGIHQFLSPPQSLFWGR